MGRKILVMERGCWLLAVVALVCVGVSATAPNLDDRLLSPGSAGAEQPHAELREAAHESTPRTTRQVAAQIQTCLKESRRTGRDAAKALRMVEELISPFATDLGESAQLGDSVREDPLIKAVEQRADADAEETLELRSAAQDESASEAMDDESSKAQLSDYMQLQTQKTGEVIDTDREVLNKLNEFADDIAQIHKQISHTLKLQTKIHSERMLGDTVGEIQGARTDTMHLSGMPIAIKMQRIAYQLSKHAVQKVGIISHSMKEQLDNFQHVHNELSETIESEFFNPTDSLLELSESDVKGRVSQTQVYHENMRGEEQLQRAAAISKKMNALVRKDNQRKEEMLNRVQTDASSSAWSTYNSALQARKVQMLNRLKVADQKLEGAKLVRAKVQNGLAQLRDQELKPLLSMIKQATRFTQEVLARH